MFTAEFKGRDKAYYAGAQAAGRLRVEETAISQPRRRGGPKEEGRLPAEAPPGALLRDGQRIRHFVHRHEPPVRTCGFAIALLLILCSRLSSRQVLDTPVHILAVTDALVAVAKPASMPVHPTVPPFDRTHAGLPRLSASAGPVPQEQRDGPVGRRARSHPRPPVPRPPTGSRRLWLAGLRSRRCCRRRRAPADHRRRCDEGVHRARTRLLPRRPCLRHRRAAALRLCRAAHGGGRRAGLQGGSHCGHAPSSLAVRHTLAGRLPPAHRPNTPGALALDCYSRG